MKSFYLIVQFLIINIGFCFAQTVDDSYRNPVPKRPAKICAIKVQQDGKILLGGDIAFFKEERVNNLIRLNPDGTLDEGFDFKGNNDLLIERIELQSSGDMVVLAQQFVSQTETYSYLSSLFWLDASGGIKKQINTLSYISSISIQDDDKVLACGVNNTPGFLNRYNADLTIDNSFSNSMMFNNQVDDVVFKNGRIYAAGTFTMVSNTVINNIVKLYRDGTIDNTFSTGTGTPTYIGSLTIQDDGKILPGNTYIQSYNGIQYEGMMRLNPDGSVDTAFHAPDVRENYSQIVVKDSSIYFSANYLVNEIYGCYVFRLKLNGEMDTAFKPILIDDFGFRNFRMDFSHENMFYNNSSRTGNIYGVSQCDQAGDLIGSFRPEISRYGVVIMGDSIDGKLVVSGDFIKVDEHETFGIARINRDGTIDQSFSLSKNLGKPIQIKVLNDSCLLFSTGKSFVKLNAKGEIMPDFNFHPFKLLMEVLKFRVLNNGKIYASYGYNVYRLNSDGTEDISFDIGSGIGGPGSDFDFDLQDDKVIYGSLFDHYNGIPVNKLVRLNSDGSLDQTFDIGIGPNDLVTTIKVLSSGEVIIAGRFKYFNGIPIPNSLVKLTPNGSIDNSFNENQKLSILHGIYWFNTKVEQSDSMLYIRGMNLFGLAEVIAVHIDGRINRKFVMPMTVNQINDIIVLQSDTLQGSSTKSTYSDDASSYMFALGNFENIGSGETSFIMKLALGRKKPDNKENDPGDYDLYLYPMPVTDKLRISFSKPDIGANVNLYTLNGQHLYSTSLYSSYGEIDMHNFAAGVYVVKITTDRGKTATYRIAKK